MASQVEVAEPAEQPDIVDHATADDADPTRPWWHRIHWGLVAVIVVAAVLRWMWLGYARPVPVSDFRHYLDAALTMIDRGQFGVGQPSAWRLPAFPAFLAVGAWISRDVFFLSALTAALSVVQVGLTYWLAWLVFGRQPAAVVAGLVAAVLPAFVTYAPVLASEHLLAVCVLGALIAALRVERWFWAMSLLAGVLLGVGVLTRGEAAAYLPAIMLVVAVGVWKANPPQRVWVALGAASAVVVGTLAVVGPWIARNETVVGDGAGLSTTGGFNFYLAHSPGPYGWRRPLPLPLQVEDEILRNQFGWTYGLKYVRDHPEDWAPTIRDGTRELLAASTYAARYATVEYDEAGERLVVRDDIGVRSLALSLAGRSSHWLLWAGLGGMLLLPVWRKRVWVVVIAIVLANWVVYAVIFWAQARYRFVVDALACVAVGAFPAAIAAASSWVGDGWGRSSRHPPTPEEIIVELHAVSQNGVSQDAVPADAPEDAEPT
jgi:4-amino-4-deoxy-L-arabinose transferase-like glycosyltransferase